jgi:DNA-binding XRE family transcriptional regulator
MEKKIESQFIDHGCGFPILLLNVPMIKVRGKWIPDIDYEVLEKSVLLGLCHKPSKLTGSEIRFIRLYFEMTLQTFAKRFGVQHPTVVKWEKFKNMPTNMTLGTEKDIRLFVIKELRGKTYVADLYTELEQAFLEMSVHKEPLQINIEKLAC